MVAADDGAPEARPPRLIDLVALCRRFNEEGALYDRCESDTVPRADRYGAAGKRATRSPRTDPTQISFST
jgi:hypothetical protein